MRGVGVLLVASWLAPVAAFAEPVVTHVAIGPRVELTFGRQGAAVGVGAQAWAVHARDVCSAWDGGPVAGVALGVGYRFGRRAFETSLQGVGGYGVPALAFGPAVGGAGIAVRWTPGGREIGAMFSQHTTMWGDYVQYVGRHGVEAGFQAPLRVPIDTRRGCGTFD